MGWAVMAALIVAGGAIAFAQTNTFVGTDQPPVGRIVPITPGSGSAVDLGDASSGEMQVDRPQAELPKHWIGILLGPVPDAVRAQVDIPADEGVLVRQVVPDSPAAKAGIEVFDIVLQANDQPVTNGGDLMQLVQQEGESGGKITLDVLRGVSTNRSCSRRKRDRNRPTTRRSTPFPVRATGQVARCRACPECQTLGPPAGRCRSVPLVPVRPSLNKVSV